MVIKVLYADIAVSTMLSLAVFQQPTNVAETVHLPHLIRGFSSWISNARL
jgi:hypothetical protein